VSEPRAIVPFQAVTEQDLLVVDALFDGLTAYDERLRVAPAAAESWTADDEQRVWTFTLREGARFHPAPDTPDVPGLPVTAADVARSWELAVTEGAAGFRLAAVEGYEALATGAAANLSGVEVVDERTLVVRLSAPLSTFDAVVAHPSLAPVPRVLWDADPQAFAEQPVGNGPFRAAEAWVRGQFIRAQRDPGWANGSGPAVLDEVLFQFAAPDNAYVAFQQGRLQVATLPEDAIEQAVEQFGASDDGYRGPGVLLGETPTLYFIGFDVTVPPYYDIRVRQAFSLAVDREAIVETVGERVVVADALLGGGLPNADRSSCSACVHDPDTARALFEEVGIQRLRLHFNRDGGHLPIARRIRTDLAEVGVVLELSSQAGELAPYLEELAEGGLGMFRFGWAPEHAVADELLHPLFHSSQIGRRNYFRYAAEDVDALIDEARAAPNPIRRTLVTRRAEDLVLDRDQVVVPLFRYRHSVVVDERVTDLRIDPLGRVNLHEVGLADGR
jgi:oligopeptide transport system substrate-binding protein